MATTIVYPSIDVSGTASVSTIIATAGTFAGSLTASALTVTGTATFSGTAVFLTTAQFLGTVTFSATVGFLTSIQVSGTASIGTLVVAGTTTFSGTAAFLSGATFNGFAAGSVLLGSVSISTVASSIRFSGSWSDYGILELRAFYKTSTSGTCNVSMYTDGGTTAILTLACGVGTTTPLCLAVDFYNNAGNKGIYAHKSPQASGTVLFASATANTGVLNAIQVAQGATSLTISGGVAYLYGRRSG